MTEEQRIILRLTKALGLALGALETVKLVPYDFNQDGVARVIDELRKESDEALKPASGQPDLARDGERKHE